MKKTLMVFFTLALGLGFVLSDAAPMYAQDEFTLEEVTVTAQKRVEEAQKVGIAMEIVSGEEIRELGRFDVDQILSDISNAFVMRTSEGLRVGLRGVVFDTPSGYGNGAMNAPGTVGVNINGIFTMKRPTGTGLYDVERVEVLFGPQSTLYASNSPGGNVNIETARPKLGDYELLGTLEFGSYDLLHWEGVANAPISDTFAVRAAANFTLRDGYINNGGDDEDSKSGRLRLLWQPSDRFSIVLSGEYEATMGRGMSSVNAFKNQDDVADPWVSDTELTGLPTDITLEKFYAHIEADLGFGLLTLIPAKFEDDYYETSVGEARGPVPLLQDNTSDGWGWEDSYEVRFISPADSRIQWSLVYSWYEGENYRRNTTVTRDTGATEVSDFHQFITQKAYLGNISFPFTDQFRGIAGLRYSDGTAMSERIPISWPPGPPPLATWSYMAKKAPDYKLGIEWDINEDQFLFANWSTSYRIEGEAMKADGTSIPPQEMTAYTAGIKNRFFGNKLQVNLSAYFYDYTNRVHMGMQMATFYPDGTYCDPMANPPGTCMMRPDEGGRIPGDLTMKGADLQTSWIITPKDKLDVSISYLDSWIDTMMATWEWDNQPYSDDYDLSNRRPTMSPEWTVSLDYSHNFTLPNNGTLTFRYDTRYQSDYILDWWQVRMGTDQTGYRDQEAHHIDNLTFIYASPDGRWTASAYVKNIWNYAVKRFMSMGMSTTIGPPRTYGAVLSIRY